MSKSILMLYSCRNELIKLRRIMAHSLLYDLCDFAPSINNIELNYSILILKESNFTKLGLFKYKIRKLSNIPILVISDSSSLNFLKLLEEKNFLILKSDISSDCLRTYILSFLSKKKESIHITKREKEILKLLEEGFDSKKIIGILGISYKTLSAHKRNLFIKTGVHSSSELTLWALKNV